MLVSLALHLGLFGYGVYGLYDVHQSMVWNEQSRYWPQVPGRIVSSAIGSHRGGKYPSYWLEIQYRYAVQGKQYHHDQVFFGQHHLRNEADVAKVFERVPVGKQVQVHYLPTDPQIACLETGKVHQATHFTAVVHILMLFFAFFVFVLWWMIGELRISWLPNLSSALCYFRVLASLKGNQHLRKRFASRFKCRHFRTIPRRSANVSGD